MIHCSQQACGGSIFGRRVLDLQLLRFQLLALHFREKIADFHPIAGPDVQGNDLTW